MFDKRAFLNNDDFSWQRALNCALASHLSYSDPDRVRQEAANWGFERCEPFSKKGTQGFVAWDNGIVLVAFRGTKELGDWLTNLNVKRSEDPPPYGKVHTGFFEGFNDARGRVSDILQEAGPANKKIWITGHSLGGALSTIMASEMRRVIPIHGVYTFGQPRVVNRRTQAYFRTHLHEKFFRIVNDDDVVPMVPALLKHVGKIIWFDGQGAIKKAPAGVRADDFGPEGMTEDEFEDEKKRLRGMLKQINEAHAEAAEMTVTAAAEAEPVGEEVRGLLPSVRDHFMPKYIKKVSAKVDAEN